MPMPGFVPYVTIGSMSEASKRISRSNTASSPLRSVFHSATALSQTSPLGACSRPLRYSKVTSSGAMKPPRAPISIERLQRVRRPSMLSERTALPAYSTKYPVAPLVDILLIMYRATSLAVTPLPSLPSTLMRIDFGFCWRMHCEASTISTSEVPMPKATAPIAPWVEVCESPQTIVMPGSDRPLSGPTTWIMPLRGSIIPKWVRPNSAALAARVSTCCLEMGSAMGLSWSCVGVLWSGMQKIFSGRRHLMPRARMPSKAWGVVTSWQ